MALVVIATAWGPRAAAQSLPLSTTPRGVIHAFLMETASPQDSVDRSAFRVRMIGDLQRVDPRSFKGQVPDGARVRIDSIPELGVGSDGLRRVAAFVTVEQQGQRENWYFFCAGDSIWRLEAVRRLPSMLQRTQLRQTTAALDTVTANDRTLRISLERALMPDDTLRQIFGTVRADADKVVTTLRSGVTWESFTTRNIDFGHLEEYRELDDDVAPGDLIFYSVDRRALEHVKRVIGLERIERSPQYPGLVMLVVASVEQSSIGYVNAPTAAVLPSLRQDGFIMLKPVCDGWWLYKRMQ